jgi:phage-related minor tail protein
MSREAYRAKVEAKLQEYQARVDEARARLKGAAADARLDLEKQLSEMEKTLAAVKTKAGDLAEAAEEAWSDLTKNLDDAFEGMTGAVKEFFSRKS